MNAISAALRRKLIYGVAISILLFVLAFLALPASTTREGRKSENLVGELTNLRDEYGLAQSDLGKIEPSSEAARLGSLGMYGFAAAFLWNQAAEQKKHEDFTALRQTCDQLARLQPNFEKVWDFQAHNLAYNVSVEFDDYRDRYRWVKEGIDYYIEGNRYNENNLELLAYTGWFCGHKFGRSDEQVDFRRLLKDDEPFLRDIELGAPFIDRNKAKGRDGYDNWLLSKLWYTQGRTILDNTAKRPRKGILMYVSEGIRPGFNYAEDMERDYRPDELARQAWADVHQSWDQMSRRALDSSWGITITLESYQQHLDRVQELSQELDALVPGARDKLRQEQIGRFTPLEREAWDTPAEERTLMQQMRVAPLNSQLQIDPKLIAEQATSDKRAEAIRIVDRMYEEQNLAHIVEKSYDVIQYGYWLARGDAEKTETAIAARREMFDAEQKMAAFDLDGAVAHYEAAFTNWHELLIRFPKLLDGILVNDLRDVIEKYLNTLDQIGREPPKPFLLVDLLNREAENLGEEKIVVPTKGETEATPSDDPPAEPTANDATETSPPAMTEESPSAETPPVEPSDSGVEPAGDDAKPASEPPAHTQDPTAQDPTPSEPEEGAAPAGDGSAEGTDAGVEPPKSESEPAPPESTPDENVESETVDPALD